MAPPCSDHVEGGLVDLLALAKSDPAAVNYQPVSGAEAAVLGLVPVCANLGKLPFRDGDTIVQGDAAAVKTYLDAYMWIVTAELAVQLSTRQSYLSCQDDAARLQSYHVLGAGSIAQAASPRNSLRFCKVASAVHEIEGAGLTGISADVTCLTALNSLAILSQPSLYELPQELFTLQSLRELIFADCAIGSLPAAADRLSALSLLIIMDDDEPTHVDAAALSGPALVDARIWAVPTTTAAARVESTSMQKLKVRSFVFEQYELGTLPHLTYLTLGGLIKPAFGLQQLTHLQDLGLFCCVTDVLDSIRPLACLTALSAVEVPLPDIRPAITQLKRLRRLELCCVEKWLYFDTSSLARLHGMRSLENVKLSGIKEAFVEPQGRRTRSGEPAWARSEAFAAAAAGLAAALPGCGFVW